MCAINGGAVLQIGLSPREEEAFILALTTDFNSISVRFTQACGMPCCITLRRVGVLSRYSQWHNGAAVTAASDV